MIARRVARDIIYEELRDAIVVWEIRPGQRLAEEDLAERLGISRTPVREAIRRLELERLVTRESNGQLYAAGVSEADAVRTYAVRIALEVVAVHASCELMAEEELSALSDALEEMRAAGDRGERSAVGTAGSRFHGIIHEASDNPTCQAFLAQLQPHVDRYRRLTTVYGANRATAAVREHGALLKALKARDADRAEAVLVRHLEAGRGAAVEALRAERDAPSPDWSLPATEGRFAPR